MFIKEHLLPEYKDRTYYLFSKIPFSEEAKVLEKKSKNLHLVTLDMLFT